MHSTVQFLASFSFAQMFFCILLLIPLWQKNLSIRLYALLMACGCGYIFSSMFSPNEQYGVIWWIGQIAGSSLPGVFWLVSLSVFGDHVILKRWQYGVASLTLAIPLLATFFEIASGIRLVDHAQIFGLVKYGAMLLELVLIVHALVIALQHWRDDLVQERRYIRGGVITLSALYIFLVIVIEQIFKIDWPMLSVMKALFMACLITSINFFLFQLRESSLFETVAEPSETPVKEKAASPELARIVAAMEGEKLYQKEGLTIAGFARHLSIHEYKLRHLINGEMNYRNFNDFLNHYRIQEVTQKLSSEEFASVPVLTFALESGFRSLSSFNKAFKTKHGVTPTEYRKKTLAIS